MRRHLPVLALCASASLACDGRGEAVVVELREIESPAGAGSQAPHLAVTADGRVLMSWLEPEGGGHAFRVAAIGEPDARVHTIARGTDFFVNWADIPSILALPDGSLAAHWLVRSGPGTYSYDVHVAVSRDGGADWDEPFTPHRDGTQTEHGFASLFPLDDASFGVVWLDGRDWAVERDEDAARPEMQLRFARVRNGVAGAETVLDPRICECCATAAAPQRGGGTLVVYRDRSSEEIRDIAAVALSDGRWSAPVPAHRDGWHIEGCPVNGPALAGDGERVALAWFTAADDESRVLLSFGTGATDLGEPVRIDDGAPLGRVDVILLDDGAALVSWIERVDAERAEVRVRRVTPDGGAGPYVVLAQTAPQRLSGFPRLARTGDTLFVAWTDAEVPRVRLATARLR